MVWPHGITPREASLEDVDDLVVIDRAAIEFSLGRRFPAELDHYPADEVRSGWIDFFGRPRARCLLAVEQDVPVGFIAWAGSDMVDLAVTPQVTRRGIGRALLRDATDAVLVDYPEVSLWVLEANSTAIAFYVHHGWKFTGQSRIAAYAPFSTELKMATSGSG